MHSKLKAITLGCHILDQALENIKPQLIPGRSERQIKAMLNRGFKKAGVKRLAFPTIVAFGNHTANIHHQPTNRRLKDNQIIMIDIGVRISGYCSDITRMFFIGRPKPIWLKTYQSVLSAQLKAIKALNQPQVQAKLIDSIPRRRFPIPHSVGHGLGKKIHDNPKINPQSKDIVRSGDIITIEPGRYFPGRFGVRIEDSLLKTKTGYRLLTKFPKDVRSLSSYFKA